MRDDGHFDFCIGCVSQLSFSTLVWPSNCVPTLYRLPLLCYPSKATKEEIIRILIQNSLINIESELEYNLNNTFVATTKNEIHNIRALRIDTWSYSCRARTNETKLLFKRAIEFAIRCPALRSLNWSIEDEFIGHTTYPANTTEEFH